MASKDEQTRESSEKDELATPKASVNQKIDFSTRKRSSDSGNSSCDDTSATYYAGFHTLKHLNNKDIDQVKGFVELSHKQQINFQIRTTHNNNNNMKKKIKDSEQLKSNTSIHKHPYDVTLDKNNDKQERSYSFCSNTAASSSASSINSLSNLSISPSKPTSLGYTTPDDKSNGIFRDYAKTKSQANIDGSNNYDTDHVTNKKGGFTNVGSRSDDKIKPILKKRSTLFHRHSLGEQSQEFYADRTCLSPTDNQLSPGSTKPQSILKKKFSFDTTMSNLRPILKRNSLDSENRILNFPKMSTNQDNQTCSNNNIFKYTNRNRSTIQLSANDDTTKSYCQTSSTPATSPTSSNNDIMISPNKNKASIREFKSQSPTILKSSTITARQPTNARGTHFNINKLSSPDPESGDEEDRYLSPILKYRNSDGKSESKESSLQKPVRPILKKYS